MRSFIISFLMYLHQLPQNIIGFLLILYYKGEDEFVWQGKNDVLIHFSAKMLGGISRSVRNSRKSLIEDHAEARAWALLAITETRVAVPIRSRYSVNPVGVDL